MTVNGGRARDHRAGRQVFLRAAVACRRGRASASDRPMQDSDITGGMAEQGLRSVTHDEDGAGGPAGWTRERAPAEAGSDPITTCRLRRGGRNSATRRPTFGPRGAGRHDRRRGPEPFREWNHEGGQKDPDRPVFGGRRNRAPGRAGRAALMKAGYAVVAHPGRRQGGMLDGGRPKEGAGRGGARTLWSPPTSPGPRRIKGCSPKTRGERSAGSTCCSTMPAIGGGRQPCRSSICPSGGNGKAVSVDTKTLPGRFLCTQEGGLPTS